ncbi:MAG: TIGR00180 family glycosyltransferase [Deltaproteobacteria bacterium]|nr:TIGR00180 family glycosyltransferase [Deltaproteobacteria bacterium]
MRYCRYDSRLSLMEKTREGVKQVTTPYAVFWADDDFMVPRTFESAVQFLDENPDYGLAHGKCGMFNVEENGTQFPSNAFSFYRQGENFGETASERLLNHLGSYFVTFYSIHRTEILKKSIQLCKNFQWDYHFEELVPSCLSILYGKVKTVDGLYMLRERHADAGAWTKSQNMRDVFDWVINPTFAQNWEKMETCLGGEISKIDGIPLDEAKEIVKKAFWKRLAIVMNKKLKPATQSKSTMRQVLKKNKMLHALWMALRSFSWREQDRFLLPALQRKTSPYYQDFQAVYQCLVQDKS